MNGDAGLDAMIAKLRKIEGLPGDAAREIAPLLLEAVKKTANAGTTPDGRPWAPRKKDGARALVNAADHLSFRVLGKAIAQLVLTGPDVIHNRGTTTIPQRRILPDAGAGLPKLVVDAAAEGARRAWAKIMGGA